MSTNRRFADWDELDFRTIGPGTTVKDEERKYVVVQIAGSRRGLSHVLATTDGKPARMYSTCRCPSPQTTESVMNLVTEEVVEICSLCRGRSSR